MEVDEYRIARRIAALPGAQRPALLARMAEQGLDHSVLPIVPFLREERVPLSYAQQSLWLTWKMDPASSAYNMQSAVILHGAIDELAFSQALDDLALRHEVLRTLFRGETETDVEQIVLPPASGSLQYRDLTAMPRARAEVLAHDRMRAHVTQPFDLDSEPAWRAVLLRLDDDTCWFSLVIHHIVSDGWSTSILIRDLSAFYRARALQQEPALTPLPIQFADYAIWQRDWLLSGELARQLDHWKIKLGDSLRVLPLPLDRPRPAARSGSGAFHSCRIDGAAAVRLRRLAEENGATVFMVVLTLFKLSLGRFCGVDDISVGSPIANRLRAETQDLIGYFTNLLVLRSRVSWRHSFVEQLAATRATLLEAQTHADTPFDLLVSALAENRSAGVHPFFQVKCAEQQADERLEAFSGWSATPYGAAEPLVHFDLSLDFSAGATAMDCTFAYATDIFEPATIARFADFFIALAGSVAADPAMNLHAFLPTAGNSAAMGPQFADSPRELLPDRWARSVIENPHAVAIAQAERSFSRATLDALANRWAVQLRERGVGAETAVAILAERSCEFVAAILAVWKAGGVYVPLDPALPAERVCYQLRDSGAALLMSTLAPAWDPGIPLLVLDFENTDAAPALPVVARHPAQAAYIVYTSGSTGQPKGVVVSHGALANYVQAVLGRLALAGPQRMAMVSTVAADLGHTVLFGALASGCELHLIPAEQTSDPDAFAEYMRRYRIDVLKIVPSHLQALLSAANPADVLPAARLILGGEATSWPLLDRIEALKPSCRVLNHYGPTETTVGILTQAATEALRSGATLPIGVPLDNCVAHVLDAEMNPVPQGVAGELYLGGANISRGYQRQGAATAASFVASPFASGERLYRSGDRVRMLAGGSIEFLDRVDDQVKIRGYRVELREVAQALRELPGIAQAEVIARTAPVSQDSSESSTKLLGYVVAYPGAVIDTQALRAALAAVLPAYMVPEGLVQLESLPLTVNGKLDRKALPDPDPGTGLDFEAPRGAIEEALAAVWRDVLGVEQVGRHDNFFALGGDSILSLKVVARARKRGLKLVPKQLFEHQSLSVLAEHLDRADVPAFEVPPNKIPAGCTAIRPDMLPLVALTENEIASIEAAVPGGAANIQDIYPLAPLQEGILFHHVLQTQGDAYVTSRLISFDDRERLERFIESFNRVIARQDILRTAILWEGLPEPVQVVHRQATLPFEWVEPGAVDDVGGWLTEYMHPSHYRVDVRQAPMLRAVAAHDPRNRRCLLVLLIHHLIDDNTTVKQIIEEIALFQQGREAELTTPIPFRNFIAQAKRPGSRQEHENFFRQLLGDIEEPTAPFNLLDVQGNGSQLIEQRQYLPEELALRIRQLARSMGVSAASFFHLAWALVLARTTGKTNVVFGTVLFGRMQSDETAERALGIFINTLPICLRVEHEGVGASLKKTHALLTTLLHHEHASLALAQRCSGVPGGVPLFTTLLNYRYGAQVVEARDPLAWQGIDILDGEERTNYPIGVSVDDLGDSFHLVAQVDQSIASAPLCGYMENVLWQIVQALDAGRETPVCELSILGDSGLEALRLLGANPVTYAATDPVHRLFERLAVRFPERTAVVFADGAALGYAELNRRANRLAHHLIYLGVRPETRVGIAVERSLDMVIGLLGILKAGGAYVPLDLEYPAERLAYMVEDSGIELLLTQSHVRELVPHDGGIPAIDLDTIDLAHRPEHDPAVALCAENLAYVIYTSGSTGKPKGAANRHGSLSHCMQWMQDIYRLAETDTVLHKAAFGFDVSVWEIFFPLTAGARLLVARPGDHRDPARIIALIEQYRVTTLNFVPAMLQAFLAHEGIEHHTGLRHIICGGEAMPAATQHETLARLRGASLQNLYGPTEATIHVTQWTCRDDGRNQVPIGRPISGIRTYVLDGGLNLVPDGVAGELYLGGIGLARGYLNRSALTADRFVADPFGTSGERLYRTGDLVQWNGERQLEYLGRIDHQVKIRGFRIELEEIEAQLLVQPEIREAVVVARPGAAGARLVGYVSPHQRDTIDGATLRARLSASLPDYMVPAAIVVLANLPLTPNGKVDRKALPEAAIDRDGAFEEPRGDAEQTLARIWSEVLDVAQVGRNDNFFELGGHSLLLLKLLQRLHDAFPEAALSLAQLVKQPDLIGQALLVAAPPPATAAADVIVYADTGSGVPLYCFPGTLENAASYAAVAEHLAGERPIHAFVSHALTSKRWREYSIESLAAEYAAHIRSTATAGVCALLGWSFGAQLAFETARQLSGQVDVVFLGLVDPIEHDLAALPILDDQQLRRARAQLEADFECSAMKDRWLASADRMSPALWNYFGHRLLSTVEKIPLDGPDLDSVEYRQWAVIDAMRMLSEYRHPALDMLLHIWSADPLDRAEDISVRHWRNHAAAVTEKIIEGTDHRTVLQAQAFTTDLQRVLAGVLVAEEV